jgi:hypothetical protein
MRDSEAFGGAVGVSIVALGVVAICKLAWGIITLPKVLFCDIPRALREYEAQQQAQRVIDVEVVREE